MGTLHHPLCGSLWGDRAQFGPGSRNLPCRRACRAHPRPPCPRVDSLRRESKTMPGRPIGRFRLVYEAIVQPTGLTLPELPTLDF